MSFGWFETFAECPIYRMKREENPALFDRGCTALV